MFRMRVGGEWPYVPTVWLLLVCGTPLHQSQALAVRQEEPAPVALRRAFGGEYQGRSRDGRK